MKKLTLLLVVQLLFGVKIILGAAPINVAVDREGAIYKEGEEIVFSAFAEDASLRGIALDYELKADGGILKKGKLTLDDTPFRETLRMERPGFALFSIMMPPKKGEKQVRYQAGAAVSPEKIVSGIEKPDDFNMFWADEIAKLRKVPVKVVIREAPEFLTQNPKLTQFAEQVKIYDVRLEDGVVNATGVLTVPVDAKAGECAALVTFNGASWLGATPNPPAVRDYHAIVFNMNLHDSPNLLTTTDEVRKISKEVAGYQSKNLDSRDDYYMKKVFLRIVRTLDYVKSRPEWNGRVLVVRGPSMGGCQAIVAAALDKDVTICVAGAPAMCDHQGFKNNQANGYPNILAHKNYQKDKQKYEAALKNSAYFDAANFAGEIKCEVVFGVGFIDTTCPPTSIYAAYNRVPSETKMIHNAIKDGHYGKAFSCDVKGRVRTLCTQKGK